MLYRLGAVFETSMTSFFTWWGTTAARYPLPVIVLSVAFAGNLTLREFSCECLLQLLIDMKEVMLSIS